MKHKCKKKDLEQNGVYVYPNECYLFRLMQYAQDEPDEYHVECVDCGKDVMVVKKVRVK